MSALSVFRIYKAERFAFHFAFSAGDLTVNLARSPAAIRRFFTWIYVYFILFAYYKRRDAACSHYVIFKDGGRSYSFC